MGSANDLAAKLYAATGPSDKLNLAVFEALFPNVDPYGWNGDTKYADFTGNLSSTLALIKRCAPEASVSLSIRPHGATAVVTVNQQSGSTIHPNPEIALVIATILALAKRV